MHWWPKTAVHFVGCPQACPFLKDSIAQRLAYFHPDPTELGSIPSIPEIFSAKKIIDYAKVNQWCCSEESGQCLENVDPTHLVLASGKLVQQKMLAFLIHVVVGHFYIGFLLFRPSTSRLTRRVSGSTWQPPQPTEKLSRISWRLKLISQVSPISHLHWIKSP